MRQSFQIRRTIRRRLHRWHRLRTYRTDAASYLLSSPANAARLRAALVQSRRGEGIPFTMDDLHAELRRGAST